MLVSPSSKLYVRLSSISFQLAKHLISLLKNLSSNDDYSCNTIFFTCKLTKQHKFIIQFIHEE